MMPIAVAFGWSRDETTILSNLIRYLSRTSANPFSPCANWSHMFLVFSFPDGSAVIHEALMSEGWCAKPAQKLDAWLAKNPQHHHAELRWLAMDEGKASLIYSLSGNWIGTKSYAVKQLIAIGLAESILGRWLGLSVRSGPDEVICSEGACQLVGEVAPQYDLRQDEHQSWDSVSPESAYRKFLSLPQHGDFQ
jgi:hypothetical protein